MLHLALHLFLPVLIAGTFYRKRWLFASALMLATMLVDLDHLLATPVYDAQRCSIGFHPLHQLGLIALYAGLLVPASTRLVGLGLTLHMALDALDCQINTGAWVHAAA